MDVTRRCFLRICGGATAGAIISPLPWKLLDDVSIWTQNGTWVATPPRGPITYLNTTCTLCPAGCGLHLRRAGEHTVSAWGVAGHPLSANLCPTGLGTAQMLHHPARIRGAASRGRNDHDPWRLVDTDAAITEVGRKLAELRSTGAAESVAILDLRPDRSLSVIYREFLESLGGGRYLTIPSGRDQAASALGHLVDLQSHVPGYDFEQVAGVISFGAPVFDGWCGAGPAPGLLERNGKNRSGRTPHVIQVETNASMNANLADTWLPLKPGTEAALALGLTHAIRLELADSPVSGQAEELWPGSRDLVAHHTPEHVAETTGIKPDVLRTAARNLIRNSPAVAVGGGSPGGGPLGQAEELAIWVLNLTLASVGQPGGAVLRRDTPYIFDEPIPASAESMWDIPDGSLDLLLVDGSLPGTTLPKGLLRRKMRSANSLIVGLSPYAAGATAEADLIIPTKAPGEWLDDVPPQALTARSSYAWSPAVEKAPSWSLHPADALSRVAGSAGLDPGLSFGRNRHEEILGRRLETLYSRGIGEVFDAGKGRTIALSDLGSARQLDKALSAGGCWSEPAEKTISSLAPQPAGIDPALIASLEKALTRRVSPSGTIDAAFSLTVVVAGQSVVSPGGVLPPVVNKIYRESNLMTATGVARLNPVTGYCQGLKDGRRALLETDQGAMSVTVVLDESVMPDVILMSPGPDPASMGDPRDDNNILDLCGASQRPAWRITPAKLREV